MKGFHAAFIIEMVFYVACIGDSEFQVNIGEQCDKRNYERNIESLCLRKEGSRDYQHQEHSVIGSPAQQAGSVKSAGDYFQIRCIQQHIAFGVYYIGENEQGNIYCDTCDVEVEQLLNMKHMKHQQVKYMRTQAT